MPEQKKQKTSEESKPVLEGMFVAAIFLLWGALFLYAPVYLVIFGRWRTVFHVLGGLVLTISLIVAIVKLNELWKNKAVAYWSVAMVFYIPAIFLQLTNLGQIGLSGKGKYCQYNGIIL